VETGPGLSYILCQSMEGDVSMTKRDLIAKVHDILKEYPRKDVAHAVEIVFAIRWSKP